MCGISLGGIVLAQLFHLVGIDRPDHLFNIFFHLYATNEPAGLAVVGLGTPLLLLLACRARGPRDEPVPPGGVDRLAAVCAIVAVGVVVAGTYLAHHAFPLAMDEYLADFQADILRAGRTSTPIPPDWRPFGYALTPVFVAYQGEAGVWHSTYLPVYAGIRSLLDLIGLRALTNSVLALLTILVVWRATRRLWPVRTGASAAAVILLATSPQFLITAMTGYSMPAHALLNATWLWLYLLRTPWAHAALPVVSALALGLHNVVPHTLFAAPFLVSIARRGATMTTAWVVGGFVVSLAIWSYCTSSIVVGMVSLPGSPGTGPVLEFGLPGIRAILVQWANVSLLVSWQSIALAFLVAVSIADWRHWSPVLRDLALGCLLTFGFYVFYLSDQGHGWGYRYMFPVLPGAVVLAVSGWLRLEGTLGPASSRRLLLLSCSIALLVQVPLRSHQVADFVRPFASASRHLAGAAEDVVVIDWRKYWYGQDLVRNDPLFRSRVKLMFADRLDAAAMEHLRATGRTVRILGPGELDRFGLHPVQGR